MDMSKYRDLFLSEAREYLQKMDELLLGLEESPADRELINALFRAAHSLKGMSASMGYDPVAELSHRMEDLMSRVRGGEIPFERGIGRLFFEGADQLALFLNDIEADRPCQGETGPLLQRLASYTPSNSSAEIPVDEPPQQAEPIKPVPTDRQAVPETFHTVRVRAEILDRLIDTTGELFTTKHRLLNISRDLSAPCLNDTLNDLTKLLRELHQMVMQVRLMPFALLAERFPRLVRELAQKSGKEVTFAVDGKEIELDRGILEALADPLVHIIRNAVDHGLELPRERISAGKEAAGKVRLSAWREKDHLNIAVEDDGRGIDPEHLIALAVRKGFLAAADGENLSRREAYMLICLPGFSTADSITDISGRGVGMDAVRATIQSLGGTLEIDSEPGKGSRLTLCLPLTIAVMNVLVFRAAHLTLAVQVSGVLRTVELEREQLLFRDRKAFFVLDNEEVPLLCLNRILGQQPAISGDALLPVIVAEVTGRRIGVAVDRVLGQREVHVKPVGRPLNRLRGIAGGAVLGDGEVVFLLDLPTLL